MARSHLIGNKLRLLQSCNKNRRYIRQHYLCKRRQIAKCLSSGGGSPLDQKNISDAQAELENAGISPEIIYKSGFFNMRFEQSVLGQPEDIVRIKEIKRHINGSADKLEKEYELYSRSRAALC